ncbi:hypothetical protein [Marinobacterium arenosum]|uniref:hypothetical protein n=1 Tax=Marinobacterium arenosum TaxID=2862496 RepID=UPI001C98699E|nr:hypothetical protein [Marinobacterium arenosum]MBY4677879.1 hypothetical protein [Marinobacterium arenosum]
MFSPLTVILVVTCYMAFLFGIAQLVERRIEQNRYNPDKPWLYALSLAVFHTSWSFYGSVGFASQNGLLYLGVYIGAFLGIMFGWVSLRRMVQAKEAFRITSVADFISTRYNRSPALAALVSLIALFGVTPYIALQLKAVIDSLQIITDAPSGEVLDVRAAGLLVTLFMAAFTIIFGVRRLDPTERHQGMISALVAECLVKLTAFLVVGIFVTYYLYDGFGDIAQRMHDHNISYVMSAAAHEDAGVLWLTLIILSFVGVQLLPRQFHVAVVENVHQRHIKTAMWLFPLYMVASNIFVIPIAGAGLLSNLPSENADYFVLMLPQSQGEDLITLIAFIGGFSAATGMILITTMTLATMASNHLVLPLIEKFGLLNQLHNYLLQIRWLLVAAILFGSYWFADEFADSYILVAIGLLSFAAILQLAPPLLGGLFWKRGNSLGALLGLSLGFATWWYTLALPTFIKHGWFSADLLNEGPWGIGLLRPEALFGLSGLPPISHAVFWSLLLNIAGYLIGSLLYKPNKSERNLTTEFLCALLPAARQHKARPTGLEAYIALHPKMDEAESLLASYLSDEKASRSVQTIAEDLQVSGKDRVTIIELVEFHRMVEHVLAGSIGAAGAHSAMENSIRYNERESADLKALYSHIVSELNVPTIEQETIRSGAEEGGFGLIEELQAKIDALQATARQQEEKIAGLEQKLEQRYEEVFRYRIEAQKANQEIEGLRKKLAEQLQQDL